jgi:hypothetical protein
MKQDKIDSLIGITVIVVFGSVIVSFLLGVIGDGIPPRVMRSRMNLLKVSQQN